MEATSVNQVGTQFRYNTVRPDGNKFVMQNSGNVDPYQFLNVLDVNTENKGLILDNMSTLEFTLEPAGTLEMFFYTDAVYPGMNIDNENEKIEYTMVPSIQKNGKKNNKSWLIVAAALTIIAAVYLYNLEDE